MIRRFWNWFKGLFQAAALASSVNRAQKRFPRARTQYINIEFTSTDNEWPVKDFGRFMNDIGKSMDDIGASMDNIGKVMDEIHVEKTPPSPTRWGPPKADDDDFNIN